MAAKTRAARVYPNRRGDYQQIHAPGFRWQDYLTTQYDPRLLETSEGRRAVCRLDPLAFALIYLRDWLKGEDGSVTFAKFHADSYEWALSWLGNQLPMSNRRAWVAPRGSAKSTIHFRIIPIWSLCYGHKDYISIFSRTSDHANEHMQAIQRVRLENALLRLDFPDFVAPRLLDGKGRAQHDTLEAYLAKNGGILTAKGMNSSVLGSSIDGRRANVIVLDDVENSEANYTAYQAEQVKKTITGAIAYYNVNAIWSWVGTTTMYDGLVHQMVKTTDSVAPELRNGEETDWVREQRITVRHYRPLVEDPVTGERVSMWPAKWTTEFLKSIEHTRVFRMELDNLPSLADEGMWQKEDFTYVEHASAEDARCALFVDPAVTVTETSDYTGLAVSQFPFPTADEVARGFGGRVEVLHVERRKMTGRKLRDRIMTLLTIYPQIKRVCVEDNQGAALWQEVFADLPVAVELLHASAHKEVRAAHALAKYQARPTQVVHVGRHAQVEATMEAFPAVAHDDDVDAVVYSVLYWLSPAEVRKPGAGRSRGPQAESTQSYV